MPELPESSRLAGYSGWILGTVVILVIVVVAAALWFSAHPGL